MIFAVFVTWPQSAHLSTSVATHDDAYFSMWRLAWIAHSLATDPLHLFDTNIFHPQLRTLAYSDAMLLEGVVALPGFWAGASPIVIYNVLLLLGMAGSGLAMFILARRLTGGVGPAIVAAAVYTMLPYRIEHFMHLELQWAMWIPMALWALHRTVDRASWRDGVLCGVFVWLQIISSVYYGVFLAMALAIVAPMLLAAAPARRGRALGALAIGGLAAAVLTVPYAVPYVVNAREIGTRLVEEIARYSARPESYLASPPQNWLWGWTAARWGAAELGLFPGAAAAGLAVIGLAARPRRVVLAYAVLTAAAVELSFGLNGWLYPLLSDRIPMLSGLRSPSRFSIVAFCALGVLVAFGIQVLQRMSTRAGNERLSATAPASLDWRRGLVIALALAALAVEYRNVGMLISEAPVAPRDVYQTMKNAGPGIVAEFPMPTADRLPGFDALYAFWSTWHWLPLINGYSGYYPPIYILTLERMVTFPDVESIARLKRLGVRYIVVHRALYPPDAYTALALRLATRPELRPYGTYRDPLGMADLFVLEEAAPPEKAATVQQSAPTTKK